MPRRGDRAQPHQALHPRGFPPGAGDTGSRSTCWCGRLMDVQPVAADDLALRELLSRTARTMIDDVRCAARCAATNGSSGRCCRMACRFYPSCSEYAERSPRPPRRLCVAAGSPRAASVVADRGIRAATTRCPRRMDTQRLILLFIFGFSVLMLGRHGTRSIGPSRRTAPAASAQQGVPAPASPGVDWRCSAPTPHRQCRARGRRRPPKGETIRVTTDLVVAEIDTPRRHAEARRAPAPQGFEGPEQEPCRCSVPSITTRRKAG